MTAQRRRLPNRRGSITFEFESQGLEFTCTASWFEDGSLAEIFLTNHRAGINAQDSAVVASIALQFGVPLDVLCHALMRDSQGPTLGPVGSGARSSRGDGAMIDEEAEALALVVDDAALGLTAWRTALRRELRVLWQNLDQRPAISGPDHLAMEDVGVRQMDQRDRVANARRRCK